MAAFVMDTSAVVKRYVQEIGTSWVRSIFAPDIPTFAKGQIGMFQGVYEVTGMLYAASDAKVDTSRPELLVLAIQSLDGKTDPVAFTRPPEKDES